MCHVGSKVESLQESTERHNKELVEKIEREQIHTTDFVKACTEFHSEKSQRKTIERIREQWAIVDGFDDTSNLERVLGRLFSTGTRLLISLTYPSLDEESPLHANRIVTPVAFNRAPRILSGYHCRRSSYLNECIRREKKILEMLIKFVYSDTLSIDDAMKIEERFPSYSDDWDGLELYSRNELETLNTKVFGFKKYLGELEEKDFEWDNFLIDTEFVMKFQTQRNGTITHQERFMEIQGTHV
jgi:hypothetical protein